MYTYPYLMCWYFLLIHLRCCWFKATGGMQCSRGVLQICQQFTEFQWHQRFGDLAMFVLWFELTSGKHTKNDGKSPSLIGKSTINGQFSIVFCMFTRPGRLPHLPVDYHHFFLRKRRLKWHIHNGYHMGIPYFQTYP